MKKIRLGLLATLLLVGCVESSEPAESESESSGDVAASITTSTAARKLITDTLDELVRHQPTYALIVGDRTHDDEMDDLSPAEFSRFYSKMAQFEVALKALDVSKLTFQELQAYDLAVNAASDARARREAKAELWEINTVGDIVDEDAYIPSYQTIDSPEAFQRLMKRFNSLPTHFAQRQANLEAGIVLGRTASRDVVRRHIENVVASGVASTTEPAWTQVTFDPSISPSVQEQFRSQIAALSATKLVPAAKKYLSFLRQRLLPAARASFGYSSLAPIGTPYYVEKIDFHTRTGLSPASIHALGLKRVADARSAIIDEARALGIVEPSFSALLARLRTAPGFTPSTVTEIKAQASARIAAMSAPAWSQQFGLGAPGSPDVEYDESYPGSPYYLAGQSLIVIPTVDVPKLSVDSVLAHEYTHYLQDVVARSYPQLTPTQSIFGGAAMTEGAAYYAELLALQSPTFYAGQTVGDSRYMRIHAQLSILLRAARLVLDPAIHTMGWSRNRAISYLQGNSLLDSETVAWEVDRYASYPGQALTYALGGDAIVAQAARARSALGNRFVLGAYNRMVLSLTGGTPWILERATTDFIARGGIPAPAAAAGGTVAPSASAAALRSSKRALAR